MKEIGILKQMNACKEALAWLDAQTSYEQAWQDCRRGDWMLWLIGKTTDLTDEAQLRKLTLAKAECAKPIIYLMKDGRSIRAVEIAEQFGNGKADRKQLDVAYAAAYAALVLPASAALAVFAATYATDAAAFVAIYAADAAAYAADTVAAYAADAAATAANIDTVAVLSGCADIVRKIYPEPPKIHEY